jgi:hypothetical protein
VASKVLRSSPRSILIGVASPKQAGTSIRVAESGKPFVQGMETIFSGALADPSLFHALSLVLSLATNNRLSDVEVLTHRGEILNGIRVNIKGLKGAPQVSTLTAMLLLIGYEYRIDGANGESIAAHIRGIQTMMKLCKDRNVALIDEVQRALFWQDLLSCLTTRSPRFLSHSDFQDFRTPKGVDRCGRWEVPTGFRPCIIQWPQDFALVLKDLNSLCWVVDSRCGPEKAPLEVFPVDNDQANLESRLVDLLIGCRNPTYDSDPWFEASILAVYICTYKLATGIWLGCYIPEICIHQILYAVTQLPRGPQWSPAPDLLQWILFVCGGMTDREDIRSPVVQLIREMFPTHSPGSNQTWESLKHNMSSFIWCEHTMERQIFRFWKEVYQEPNDELRPMKSMTLLLVEEKKPQLDHDANAT